MTMASRSHSSGAAHFGAAAFSPVCCPQGALSTDSQVQPEGFFSHSATLRMSFPRKLWFWDGLLISRGDKCHDGYGDQEE